MIRSGQVWFLTEGYKGGLIHEYEVREKDGQLTLQENATYELGPEVFHPTLLSRGPNGQWWVYSNYGNAFVYDQNWQYTGERHPSDSVLAGLFYLFIPLCVSIIGVFTAMSAVTLNDLPKRELLVYSGAIVLAVTLSVAVRQSLLPYPLTLIYGLQDSLVASFLLIPLIIGIGILEDRTWGCILLMIVVNLPLIVVAWDFATSVG